jgi:hypothetical protein
MDMRLLKMVGMTILILGIVAAVAPARAQQPIAGELFIAQPGAADMTTTQLSNVLD